MNGADVFGLVISLVLFCYLVYALMVRPDTKVTCGCPKLGRMR
jgi:K+-transporting ATPase KdpF subunit